jgi:hypothetical protein
MVQPAEYRKGLNLLSGSERISVGERTTPREFPSWFSFSLLALLIK